MTAGDAPLWRREEIDSPCVQVCTIHPATGLCLGCHRSREEIAGWTRMTPEARRAVTAELPNRSPAPATRRGGRRARLAGGGDGRGEGEGEA